jgi:hypothetical protein
VGLVANDAAEPAGECGRVGQGSQAEPRGDEGLLDDVLCQLQVTQECQGVAEGHLLKAPRYLRERVQVALPRPPDQRLQVHRLLHPKVPALGHTFGRHCRRPEAAARNALRAGARPSVEELDGGGQQVVARSAGWPIRSRAASPAAGPWARPIATARFSSTTGEGVRAARAW